MITINSPLKLQMKGNDVAALQDALLLLLDQLLLLKADDAARNDVVAALRRERLESAFGEATGRAVRGLQKEQGLEQTGAVDKKTADAIVAALQNKPDVVVPPPEQPRITGLVIMEHGAPAVKLPLRLYRRAFGGVAAKIAEASTGEDGIFQMSYPAAGSAAGLEVRAVAGDGKEAPLTGVLLDLDVNATLRLVAPATLQPLQPEFTRLAADLSKQIGDLKKLQDASEGDDGQDLALLNRATGWDARVIAMAAQAAGVSSSAAGNLPPETAYALLRMGLPSDTQQLARVGVDAVGLALKKAAGAGIVQMSDAQIADAQKNFTTFARDTRLAATAPGSRSTYAALLKASGISDDAQKKFATVFLAHQGPAKALWEKAKAAGLADADIGALQQFGKLAFLTMNNDVVTARLQARGIKTAAQLVDADFHKPEPWVNELRNLAGNDDQHIDALIPPAYVGAKPADRLSLYAADLARKVRIAYPTQIVARTIEHDAADPFKLGGARAPTALLLKTAAGAGFRLGTTPVRKFVADNPAVVQAVPAAQRQAAMQAAGAVQRVYQITPSNDAMQTLMSLGMTSAYDVVATSEDRFVERYGARFKPGEARLVHRKSRQVSAVTYNLFTIAKQLDAAPPVYSLSPSQPVKDAARNELIKQFPTMESLFGSMDFCECAHCRSVLGPAAYLVDLLQFTDPEPLVWGNFLEDWKAKHGGVDFAPAHKKPYDALIERRPDIPYISLTCENTNTALPYIDIVNEILEYYVAHGALDGNAAHDVGDATTAELIAEPQNIIAGAYDTLRQAKYPLALPFDLWLETVRKFCDYFETHFSGVLEAFRQGDDLFAPAQVYDRATIFHESLGLAPRELAIFTNPNPLANWFELYGYATAAEATAAATDAATGLRIDLNSAKALARRLGLSYNELVDVVSTGFVNPKLASLVLLYKIDARIQDVYFYKAAKPFYNANQDLLGKNRAALSAADQARYDALTPADWTKLGDVAALEKKLDDCTAAYPASGVNFKDWLNNQIAANTFDDILLLADPDAGCDFDKTIVRYAGGAPADAFAFLKVNLFVRLWRKLGWTIEETDRALQTFVPKNAPFDAGHVALSPLKTALIYIAHLKALDARVQAGRDSRLKLLTTWSSIGTTGKAPLYAKLFLTRGVLKNDPIFDDPLGNYLSAVGAKLKDHVPALQGALGATADDVRQAVIDAAVDQVPALQGAFGLTTDDVLRALVAAGLDPDNVPLSIESVSTVYRYSMLAKALKLTVRELIAIKRMSGLDPFKPLAADPLAQIESDNPFSQTLAFVDVVDWIRDIGLKVADLEYLLRHRFDENGPYRLDTATVLALVKSLAEGVGLIQAANIVPADPGGLSEDALRQKLGLALPSDVVATFLAMLDNTVETTVTRAGVLPADQLKTAAFADETAIVEVRYNAVLQEQTLTFRGVLLDPQKNDLKARLPKPVAPAPFAASAAFSALLDQVQADQQAFFAKYLRKSAAGVEPASGFLDPADFDLLFAPPAAGLSDAQLQARVRNQRARLATAFLPYLQQHMTRQLIVETMTAQLSADQALVETLLTNASVVGDPESLLNAFAATATRGVTVNFYGSHDATGASLSTAVITTADTGMKDSAGNPVAPAAMRSATIEGCLEVPASGPYRFFVVLDKQNAKADLTFDHLSAPLIAAGTAVADGSEVSAFLDLRPGLLYRFRLVLQDLNAGGARVLVQGESLPKDRLLQLPLYPQSVVTRATGALVLARKVLQIAQSLPLTERELLYFVANAASFDNLDFSKLPVTVAGDSTNNAQKLFKAFTRLATYARLKRDVAGGTEGLVSVFEAPDRDTAYGLVALVTRRETAVVKATAEALWAAPVLSSERTVRRLWDALQIVERFSVPVASVAGWPRILAGAATPGDRFAVARSVRESIKARVEPDAWQKIAQPIFDALRQRQRDALVAYVMWRNNFVSREQLYEYFLIDPGMEPVVQTSRIRLAIGSVQLFIQRCLLNLEKFVPPGAINAKQWEWTSRYRVWEANRKIFLFPENWLEPEFRDGKTHLCAELEGTLLQGDLSSDMVEDAFLTYVQKLDALARLDIVAMHLQDDADSALRTLHVFGRTHGSPHQYFYRRYAHEVWTPWEPVTPKIDGDHLAPVWWRDRLYLFWVTFEFRAQQMKGAMTIDDPTKQITIPMPLREVYVQLHWAGCLGGEWTTPESSDVMNVMKLVHQSGGKGKKGKAAKKTYVRVPLTVEADFYPASVSIHVSKEPYEDGEERGVLIHLGDPVGQAFYLAGRNATPSLENAEADLANPYSAAETAATRYRGQGSLSVTYNEKITTEAGKPPTEQSVTSNILAKAGNYTLLPCDDAITLGAPDPSTIDADNPAAVAAAQADGLPEIAALIKPFFYADDRTTLFVQPDVKETTIEEWEEWVTPTQPPQFQFALPEWWSNLMVVPAVPYKQPPIPIGPDDYMPQFDGLYTLPETPGQDWLTNATTGLLFKGEVVGKSGRAVTGVTQRITPAGATPVRGVANVIGGAGLKTGPAINIDRNFR